MMWDEPNLIKRGFPKGMPDSLAVVRYVAGCIKRERQRLGGILKTLGAPQAAVDAVLDASDDQSIFQWKGPETHLVPSLMRPMPKREAPTKEAPAKEAPAKEAPAKAKKARRAAATA